MRYFVTNLLYILFFLSSGRVCTQSSGNLDFEVVGKNSVAVGWNSIIYANDRPYYSFSLDSNTVQNGKYSLNIVSDSFVTEGNYAYCRYALPVNFEGKKITIKCFIKTSNIAKNDYAGLWMRIYDQNFGSQYIASPKDMAKGDSDWTEYEISFPLNKDDDFINLGVLLQGKGKAWFDNIRLYIDDKPIELAKTKNNKIGNNVLSYDSKINLESLSKRQIRDLSLLGKIWGFLKYHHPIIARGKFNWDFELFKIMPQIVTCSNKNLRDKILIDWIESFGQIDTCVQCPNQTLEDYKQKPTLDWINSNQMNQKLVDKLLFIHKNRNQSKHYYIAKAINGNPKFTNEASYPEMILPDVGFRLLALFRFWNMMEYYFPYKYAIKESDWGNIIDEFIPRMIAAKDTKSYRLTLAELVSKIHDTHAGISFTDIHWKQQIEGVYFMPVQLIFIDNNAVVAGFFKKEIAEQTQLLLGDIILEVDGKSVKQIIREQLKISSASNETVQLNLIAQRLLRGFKPEMTLKINRNGKIHLLNLKRTLSIGKSKVTWLPRPDSCYRFLSPSIGYIYLGNIQMKLLPTIFEQFKNTKGIVIDIRNYPAQFVVFALSQYLLPKKTPFVKFSMMDINNPGFFKWDRMEYVGSENPDYYKGKVILLVNENTLSQAEYTALALRTAPQVTVIGSQTAGADGDVSAFTLPGNFQSYISGIGIYYPDGRETQRVGIVPDIIVKPSLLGVKANKDEVLEKAMEIIKQ